MATLSRIPSLANVNVLKSVKDMVVWVPTASNRKACVENRALGTLVPLASTMASVKMVWDLFRSTIATPSDCAAEPLASVWNVP